MKIYHLYGRFAGISAMAQNQLTAAGPNRWLVINAKVVGNGTIYENGTITFKTDSSRKLGLTFQPE
jgi:hypothetical protein